MGDSHSSLPLNVRFIMIALYLMKTHLFTVLACFECGFLHNSIHSKRSVLFAVRFVEALGKLRLWNFHSKQTKCIFIVTSRCWIITLKDISLIFIKKKLQWRLFIFVSMKEKNMPQLRSHQLKSTTIKKMFIVWQYLSSIQHERDGENEKYFLQKIGWERCKWRLNQSTLWIWMLRKSKYSNRVASWIVHSAHN